MVDPRRLQIDRILFKLGGTLCRHVQNTHSRSPNRTGHNMSYLFLPSSKYAAQLKTAKRCSRLGRHHFLEPENYEAPRLFFFMLSCSLLFFLGLWFPRCHTDSTRSMPFGRGGLLVFVGVSNHFVRVAVFRVLIVARGMTLFGAPCRLVWLLGAFFLGCCRLVNENTKNYTTRRSGMRAASAGYRLRAASGIPARKQINSQSPYKS